MSDATITVVGAGVFGLWQALQLARAGYRVCLLEASSNPFETSASRWAGAMISPDCEAESAPEIVRTFGREGLAIWKATYPGLATRGSLVVAAPRDRAELSRFAQRTSGGRLLGSDALADLEPGLATRFTEALYFPDEAHMETPLALAFLLQAARNSGVDVCLGHRWDGPLESSGIVIDCRGIEARGSLPEMRGVRGERLLLRSREVELQRPVRLLHPRSAFYIVPWAAGIFMVGATIIESEDETGMTMRSALELMGLAYALHPAFGEAEIVELSAGVRPAFADNVPRAIVRGQTILVNGAYRHGFLLAPVLADAVVRYVTSGAKHELLRVERGLARSR